MWKSRVCAPHHLITEHGAPCTISPTIGLLAVVELDDAFMEVTHLSAYELRARTGRDSKLIIFVRADMADCDVRILVEQQLPPAVNGDATANGKHESWREFLDRTYGSIPDFPDVMRPGSDKREHRTRGT